jgi:hypothetical protein
MASSIVLAGLGLVDLTTGLVLLGCSSDPAPLRRYYHETYVDAP